MEPARVGGTGLDVHGDGRAPGGGVVGVGGGRRTDGVGQDDVERLAGSHVAQGLSEEVGEAVALGFAGLGDQVADERP